jgi:NitT/TauT family transport system substrate-binding protein/putative hydroxymethylpyrimidine transport system substrate-binding protein
MARLVASLAAVALALALAGCGGGDGAEPGASNEATLVLDFTPNAVHAPLYYAERSGLFERADLDLEIREPSSSSDAPKLLESGRADFAILDINDFGIARARGLRLRAVAAIVQVPLAAVIAGDRGEIGRPRDLEGRTVGVTGLPSDDAVLDAVVTADGGDPDAVERTTIGFDSVPALTTGAVDAATAFWNAEGVQLRDAGLPTAEFRVGDATERPYPELVVVTTEKLAREQPKTVGAVVAGLESADNRVERDPRAALDALVQAVPELDEASQERQFDALIRADAFGRDPTSAIYEADRDAWLNFAIDGGLIEARDREAVARGFELRE